MMITLSKLGCLAIYALAIAGWLGLLSGSLASVAQIVTLLMLGLHALEALLMRKQLQTLGVPPARAFALTLVFGLLYWKPLLDQRARAKATSPEVGS